MCVVRFVPTTPLVLSGSCPQFLVLPRGLLRSLGPITDDIILLDTLRSAGSGSGLRSLPRFAHRIRQTIVYSVGPGDKLFALWVLQVVLYFVFDSLPDGSRALNLALP